MPTGTIESIRRILLCALEGRVRRWDYIQIRARTKSEALPGHHGSLQKTPQNSGFWGPLSGVQAVPGGSARTQELGARVG